LSLAEAAENAEVTEEKSNGRMESWNGGKRKCFSNIDDLAKSLLERHPGESRGPEHLEMTGFRPSPE
jgi:hypothetical protein